MNDPSMCVVGFPSDFDECDESLDGSCKCAPGMTGCLSFCANTDGSADCSCSAGFVLDTDGLTCMGNVFNYSCDNIISCQEV